MTSFPSETPAAARVHREKIFGWISVENIVQTFVLGIPLIIFFVKQSDAVDSLRAGEAASIVQIQLIAAQVAGHTIELQSHQDLISENKARIDVLSKDGDKSRELLTNLTTNVGILLERTDPKKR